MPYEIPIIGGPHDGETVQTPQVEPFIRKHQVIGADYQPVFGTGMAMDVRPIARPIV